MISLWFIQLKTWGLIPDSIPDTPLFHTLPAGPGSHSLVQLVVGLFLADKLAGGVTLTTHLHIVSNVKKDCDCFVSRLPCGFTVCWIDAVGNDVVSRELGIGSSCKRSGVRLMDLLGHLRNDFQVHL